MIQVLKYALESLGSTVVSQLRHVLDDYHVWNCCTVSSNLDDSRNSGDQGLFLVNYFQAFSPLR